MNITTIILKEIKTTMNICLFLNILVVNNSPDSLEVPIFLRLQNSDISKFRNSDTTKLWNYETLKLQNSYIEKFQNTAIRKLQDSETPKFQNSEM